MTLPTARTAPTRLLAFLLTGALASLPGAAASASPTQDPSTAEVAIHDGGGRLGTPVAEPGPRKDRVRTRYATEAAQASRTSTGLDTLDARASAAAYTNQYEAAIGVPFSWTGDIANCVPGAASAAYHDATFVAINYMRALAGMDPVSDAVARSGPAQEAALMMSANRQLSHYPPTNWKCYTDDGAQGAKTSNLALGLSGAKAIGLYMDDPGSGNYYVGHRGWILTPTLAKMASGDTPNTNALTVIGVGVNAEATVPEHRAWPSPGYFPQPLVPAWSNRWSYDTGYEAGQADLTDATVRVTTPTGQSGSATVEYSSQDRLVWNPAVDQPAQPGAYTVRLSNLTDIVTGDPRADIVYTVAIFDPAAPAPGAATISGTAKVGSQLSASGGAGDALTYEWRRWLSGRATVVSTQSTYTLTDADAGARLEVRITRGTESSLSTAVTEPVASDTAPRLVSAPEITGYAQTGETLTATSGTWTPQPTTTTYQWLREGAPIPGATGGDYVLVPADVGSTLRVQVRVSSGGSGTATALSDPTDKVVQGSAPWVTQVTTTGPMRVGTKVVAHAEFSAEPAQVRYQWLRDLQPIAGADRAWYKLVAADRGRSVTVVVESHKPGYYPTSGMAEAFTVLPGTAPQAAFRPRLNRPKPVVGQRVRVTVPSFSPTAKARVQWFAGKNPIPGATRATFKVTSAQLGKRLRVVITGRRAGHTPAKVTSARSAPVRAR